MPEINQEIPEQGFSLTQKAIAAVLTTELINQKALKNLSEDIQVYVGRSTPFSQSEILMINVLLDSANYNMKTSKNRSGETGFFVDIYTSAKETSDSDGGYASEMKRNLFMGMIMFILSDEHYRTLNFEPGLIMGTSVDGFECYEPQNSQDSSFVKMARVSFSARINEENSLWDGVNINTIFTDVKLDLTDKGYVFSDISN